MLTIGLLVGGMDGNMKGIKHESVSLGSWEGKAKAFGATKKQAKCFGFTRNGKSTLKGTKMVNIKSQL